MRLYNKNTQEEATTELLDILSKHPEGVRTTELSGTPRFHGVRTLRNQQIIRLLKESGKAQYRECGRGRRTWYEWTLRAA